jgi:hypothetical protein
MLKLSFNQISFYVTLSVAGENLQIDASEYSPFLSKAQASINESRIPSFPYISRKLLDKTPYCYILHQDCRYWWGGEP